MPLNSSVPAVPSYASNSRNRSLLSRFTAPFTSKSRNLSEFYIKLEEPYRQYAPGEVVHGSVVLTVVKPVRVSHLVVCLQGYAKVFKNSNSPGKDYLIENGITDGRGKKGIEYTGNGSVSIFKDELSLCGEGRLKEGIYEFRFQLEFPNGHLPSSIDFERGTISYLITSTLTRPTTISPTSACDRKIFLIETIDIAPLVRTKSRTISLEPISRRLKARDKSHNNSHLFPSDATLHRSENSSVADSTGEPRTNVLGSLENPPGSPTPSDISSISAVSNSTSSFRVVTEPSLPSLGNAKSFETRSTTNSVSDKTITATTYIMRTAGMAGDTLPIKVSINHTKPVKSMLGVIVTLYRQGRIDSNPILPSTHSGKGKGSDFDDILPKSKTGLSGLSLTSAGTTSTFRKDLSQTVAPLLVDPQTLKAEVKASVRIPENVFPTITAIPGDIISFKYFIEVIIDLRGKLARQDRLLQRWGMSSLPSAYGNENMMVNRNENDGTQTMSAWNGVVLDTDQIRRDRSVVACSFEIVVGTKDSERKKPKSGNLTSQVSSNDLTDSPNDESPQSTNGQDHANHESEEYYQEPMLEDEVYDYQMPLPPEQPYPMPTNLPDQEDVDEKTRLRQAEQVLLPSQPTITDSAGPSAIFDSSMAPTAPGQDDLYGPCAPIQDDLYGPSRHPHNGFLQPAPSWTPASASSIETVTVSAPDYHSRETPVGPDSEPQEDKQELERRRLLTQASAPDYTAGESSNPNTGTYDQPEIGPSAPVLPEDDEQRHYNELELGVSPPANSGEGLPQYQR
ncbi:MAG: ph-response sensor protein [Cirrosporium novae-zelandiae]|nr:MAG: ph-response sensor protein [Cirrosporium novae-zelandiae]